MSKDKSKKDKTKKDKSQSAFGSKFGSNGLSAGSAFGSSLWEWRGTTWELREDHTRNGGEAQQPTQPGEFVGQFRSIASSNANKRQHA